MTTQHKAMVQDLTNQLKDIKTVLEEQKRVTQQEIDQKRALQKSLTESQNTIEQLKSKITELENSRPNPGKIDKYYNKFTFVLQMTTYITSLSHTLLTYLSLCF